MATQIPTDLLQYVLRIPVTGYFLPGVGNGGMIAGGLWLIMGVSGVLWIVFICSGVWYLWFTGKAL